MPTKKQEEMITLIEKGLKRAALRAREVAFATNTPIVIMVDGEVKEVMVSEQDIIEYRESIKDAL